MLLRESLIRHLGKDLKHEEKRDSFVKSAGRTSQTGKHKQALRCGEPCDLGSYKPWQRIWI